MSPSHILSSLRCRSKRDLDTYARIQCEFGMHTDHIREWISSGAKSKTDLIANNRMLRSTHQAGRSGNMLGLLRKKSRLSFSVIVRYLLVVQCLLHMNVGCGAHNLSVSSMPQKSPDTEAKTSDEITGGLVSTQLQAQVASEGAKSIVGRLKQAANLMIAPARDYFQLVMRYKHWRRDYNQLQGDFGYDHLTDEPILRDATDVLRIEYAKVDQQLHQEACNAKINSTEAGGKVNEDVENVDFILRVLKLLIDRLEDRLEMLKQGGVKAALDEQLKKADAEAEREAERLEASVKDAAERAKRITAKSAKGFLVNEIMHVVMTLAVNTVASYVVNSNLESPDALSVMSRIEPLILVMGHANTGLLVSYMRDIKMRAFLRISNYSLSMFSCKRKPEPSSNSSSTPAPQPIEKEIVETKDYEE